MTENSRRPELYYDSIEREYIFDHGWIINEDGKIHLTNKQAKSAPYMGRSIRHNGQRTIMIPSIHGCCLLFEGQHFVIKER